MGNTAKIRHRRKRRLERARDKAAGIARAKRRFIELDDAVIRVIGPRPLTIDEVLAAYSSERADG